MWVIPRGSLASLEASLPGHRGVDLVVTRNLFLELPECDVILLNPGRPSIAVDLGPFQQTRIDTGGGLDDA